MFADAPPPPAPITVSEARVTPRKIFLGRDPARMRFTLSADQASATVEIVAEKGGRIARRIVLNDIPAGVPQRVSWNGATGRGDAAQDGRYRVRLIVPGAGARRLLGQFVLRGHMYPIRGATPGPRRDRLLRSATQRWPHARRLRRERRLRHARLRPRAPAR